MSPSSRYFWVEENDPRGENVGSWIINQRRVANDFAGSPAWAGPLGVNHEESLRPVRQPQSKEIFILIMTSKP